MIAFYLTEKGICFHVNLNTGFYTFWQRLKKLSKVNKEKIRFKILRILNTIQMKGIRTKCKYLHFNK